MQVLWDRRATCKDAVYEFTKDIILLIGKNPYHLFYCYFTKHIENFYSSRPLFFRYEILQAKLGPINWNYRYQLNFTAYGLNVYNKKNMGPLIKNILKYADTLARVCKQSVLAMYFNYLRRSGCIPSWKKRKTKSLIKYLVTKINVEVKAYHRAALK